MKIILSIILSLFALPALAQSTAEQTQPGTLSTTSCPGGAPSCFVPLSSANPLPVGVYGGTSGNVLTSNGTGVPATFQPASGGGSSNFGTSSTAVSPQISGDATSGFYTPSPALVNMAIGGQDIMQWGASANGDYFDVTSGSGFVTFAATGPDTNIAIDLSPKGLPLITMNTLPAIYMDSTDNIGLGFTSISGNLAGGTGNIGIGGAALNNVSPGSNNVGIGQGALLLGTAITGNIGIGTDALVSAQGNYNVGVGHLVGLGTIGGFDTGNILIGSPEVETYDFNHHDNSLNIGYAIWGANMGGNGGSQAIAIGPDDGNPPTCGLDLSRNTDAVQWPLGTTGQRPSSPQAGMTRFNTNNTKFEGYDGSWRNFLFSNSPIITGTTTFNTGATNNALISPSSVATYNIISLNNTSTASSAIGVEGGGGSDSTLYLLSPTSSGVISERINNIQVCSTNASGVKNCIGGLQVNGANVQTLSKDHISFAPGLLTTTVTTGKAGFNLISAASTVDNLVVSAASLSTCTTNPTVTMYECGTSATCATPTTISSVTISAADTAVSGTISSANITAGDYIAFAVSAGACASLNIAGAAQIHSN